MVFKLVFNHKKVQNLVIKCRINKLFSDPKKSEKMTPQRFTMLTKRAKLKWDVIIQFERRRTVTFHPWHRPIERAHARHSFHAPTYALSNSCLAVLK